MILNYLQPKLAHDIEQHPTITDWLSNRITTGLKVSSAETYAYSVMSFLRFCQAKKLNHVRVKDSHVLRYLAYLQKRPFEHDTSLILKNAYATATQRKHLTSLRLYYGYLAEQKIRPISPLISVKNTGKAKKGQPQYRILPVGRKLKWIPNEEQWHAFLNCMKAESLRNQLMLLLSYEGALRKNELCTLEVSDISGVIITIRAENNKTNCDQRVTFSPRTRRLLDLYLKTRPTPVGEGNAALFLSESKQNRGQGITGATWRKVIDRIAEQTNLPQFTPHTLRHLSITHFAEQGYSAQEVSDFARHQSIASTAVYRHTTPRQLVTKAAHTFRNVRSSQQR